MRIENPAAEQFEPAPVARAWSTPHASYGGGWPELLVDVVDKRLAALVPGADAPPQRLHAAMRYTLLAPGKRLRPLLTLLTSFHLGRDDLRALDAACAIEMIHAASLVFDDLPAMDNSRERRGQPTAHRKFGEDVAILAGIALMNRAFGVVAAMQVDDEASRSAVARVLSDAVGSDGLVGGQFLDLHDRDDSVDRTRMERVNRLKTAALFVASAEAGAVIAGANAGRIAHTRAFAAELGLAYQIADDLIDDARYAGQTGKDTGKDAGKPTVTSLLGREAARAQLEHHVAAARRHVQALGMRSTALMHFIDTSRCAFKV